MKNLIENTGNTPKTIRPNKQYIWILKNGRRIEGGLTGIAFNESMLERGGFILNVVEENGKSEQVWGPDLSGIYMKEDTK